MQVLSQIFKIKQVAHFKSVFDVCRDNDLSCFSDSLEQSKLITCHGSGGF